MLEQPSNYISKPEDRIRFLLSVIDKKAIPKKIEKLAKIHNCPKEYIESLIE